MWHILHVHFMINQTISANKSGLFHCAHAIVGIAYQRSADEADWIDFLCGGWLEPASGVEVAGADAASGVGMLCWATSDMLG